MFHNEKSIQLIAGFSFPLSLNHFLTCDGEQSINKPVPHHPMFVAAEQHSLIDLCVHPHLHQSSTSNKTGHNIYFAYTLFQILFSPQHFSCLASQFMSLYFQLIMKYITIKVFFYYLI